MRSKTYSVTSGLGCPLGFAQETRNTKPPVQYKFRESIKASCVLHEHSPRAYNGPVAWLRSALEANCNLRVSFPTNARLFFAIEILRSNPGLHVRGLTLNYEEHLRGAWGRV